ncbi:uncharacterized protein Z518_07525 [Rhinocladiella mackenziei CBS 650.93]|uniref:Rhinocladiella mackenziei CBS 650.93 unplaced genomic scaffold supercont1.5, whole genome shotgun sequence n=1 Tax=Rhinocladiella mackenziei CBS 650.93 TaxID=1442369 RepID=A0A0D2FPB3_9EURO|nr:uncharacterized protein Z518_07525 [Rhinocladiella mackenziei CBS 650.93]KIX03972.1 hypothetical protein Z518_07525 [Rhinocladiella mackenziei CBS 650.93]
MDFDGKGRRWVGSETEWPEEFSTPRDLHEDDFLCEVKRDNDADKDDVNVVLTNYGDAASLTADEVLEDFGRGVSLQDVEDAIGPAGHRRAAWLDDRTYRIHHDRAYKYPILDGSGDSRQYANPLTGTGLLRALRELRFNHSCFPDAPRRLIYITDLDPAFVHALAATASIHQTPVLKDAIHKHLESHTSIAVKIPSEGFLTFQLNLHLPFFLLRKAKPPDDPVGGINTKPRRRWTALPFLRLERSRFQDQESEGVWGIHDAHISVVVAGSHDLRYTAYGFVDTEIDGYLTDCEEEDLRFDRIAGGEIEADTPIWRARDYYLKIFEIRIDKVREEWEYLMHKLEPGVQQYMADHPFTVSCRSALAGERSAEMKEAFDWALQTMGLLRRLHGVLSDTVDAWASFSSPGEDIGYFQSSPAAPISQQARRSLRAVRTTFRELHGYQKRLALLIVSCSDFSETLNFHLKLEGKESADYHGVNSEVVLSLFYPVALVAAIFSVKPEAIPFDMNPKSFFLATLAAIIIAYTIRAVVQRLLASWPSLRRTVTAIWAVPLRGKVTDKPRGREGQDGLPPVASTRSRGRAADMELAREQGH